MKFNYLPALKMGSLERERQQLFSTETDSNILAAMFETAGLIPPIDTGSGWLTSAIGTSPQHLAITGGGAVLADDAGVLHLISDRATREVVGTGELGAFPAGNYNVYLHFIATSDEKGTVSKFDATTIIGYGTEFTKILAINRDIIIGGNRYTVLSVTDDTHLTVQSNLPAITGAKFQIGGWFIEDKSTMDERKIYVNDQYEYLVTASTLTGNHYKIATFHSDGTSISALTDTRATAVAVYRSGDSSIITAKIADNSVTNAKMADNSVGTAEIINGNVTIDKMANNSVGFNQVLNSSLDATKFINSAVTTPKIADNAITTPKIANGNITFNKMDNNSVGVYQLIDSCVETTKLTNGAVTHEKMHSDSVGTAEIINLNVTTDKIAIGAVHGGTTGTNASAQIAYQTITTENIADGAITELKIHNESVSAQKIKSQLKTLYSSVDDGDGGYTVYNDLTVTPDYIGQIGITGEDSRFYIAISKTGTKWRKLLSNTEIVRDDIADSSVGTDKIEIGAVHGGTTGTNASAQIAYQTITTENIANGAITTNKLDSTLQGSIGEHHTHASGSWDITAVANSLSHWGTTLGVSVGGITGGVDGSGAATGAIAANTIVTGNIANDAITPAKMGSQYYSASEVQLTNNECIPTYVGQFCWADDDPTKGYVGISTTDSPYWRKIDHTHSNKSTLDEYTQSNTNIADAVSKKHTHSNLTALGRIAESGTDLTIGDGYTGNTYLKGAVHIPTTMMGGAVYGRIVHKTTNYTVDNDGAGDYTIIFDVSNGEHILTLPEITSANIGRILNITSIGTGGQDVVINAHTGQIFDHNGASQLRLVDPGLRVTIQASLYGATYNWSILST